MKSLPAGDYTQTTFNLKVNIPKALCNIGEILYLVKVFVPLYNSFMTLEEQIAQLLTRRRKTLSTGESCTGGLLANRITNVAGSSNFFKLGVITYANQAKTKLLKVTPNTLKKYGAVSSQTALAMAQGVRKILNSDYGIGVTGIAGPSGATKDKPVGLVYIALSKRKKAICVKSIFKGTRTSIKSQAATKALKLLLKFIV